MKEGWEIKSGEKKKLHQSCVAVVGISFTLALHFRRKVERCERSRAIPSAESRSQTGLIAGAALRRAQGAEQRGYLCSSALQGRWE